MKRIVILNPKSRHGLALKAFDRQRPLLEKNLGSFDLYLTDSPKDCTRKVSEILSRKEYKQILIAGGDGSINEAINGYFNKDGKVINASIPLGIINLGTGGDFFKTINKRSADYHKALRENNFKLIDCGLSTLEDKKNPHYFINITSIGMGGEVNRQMKSSKFQLGVAAYFYHALTVLFKYEPPVCRIKYKSPDGKWNEFETGIVNLFVCNAEFNGGGMRWAPNYDLEDGIFDIVIVSNVSKIKLVTESHKIYSGKVSTMTGVREFHATEMHVVPVRTISQEIDGEVREIDFLKTHEFHFKMLPKAIPVIM
ncbi:MAG: YegS/Rv2252/BmrU family lipid kinase [Leptospira sp.]|nr:YegS/Rv2252/BmrU family lipid kinase [Leptospira sp.]